MAYQISSTLVNVDVSFASKTVQLPPASTVLGRMFLIRDLSGNASTPPSYYFTTVSTTGLDTFDFTTNPISLASPYASVRLIAQSTTNYAILSVANTNNTWPTS